MRVIGISGKARSGKDYLVSKYFIQDGYYQVSLAWHFKVWLVATGQATYEEVFVTKPPHIRELMQLEGTERGRDVYGENIWVNTAFTWMRLFNDTWGVNKFVIADVRFPNEVESIIERGGEVYRIIAPNRIADSNLTDEQRNHRSETSLDNYPIEKFTGLIYNDYEHESEIALQMSKILNTTWF